MKQEMDDHPTAGPLPQEADAASAKAARRTAGARGAERSTRNPERTRTAILDAARREISEKGLAGARIDVIARRAGTNKRMLYHYYGDKDAIYRAVLEDAYRAIRFAERRLDLTRRDPEEGLRELALFTWHYFLDHPEFLSVLATENFNQGRYLRGSETILEMNSNLITELADVLRRGAEKGVFKRGLDPVQVYITIASLGAFYLSNRFTLSAIFQRDLQAPQQIESWGEHIAATTLASVRL